MWLLQSKMQRAVFKMESDDTDGRDSEQDENAAAMDNDDE